ncbi:MAG: AAA family ATPase [Peptococcaceae bacterium]|nr:AAA family ATPase [Peptococcaceae bacterium]
MADLKNKLRVPVERLRRYCRPDELGFETTAEVQPLKDFIGQERAVRAMQFGVTMRAPGYNVYVAGPTGTGKSTYINDVLRWEAVRRDVPDDWCYLYNFADPDQPRSVSLPAGRGKGLQKDMEDLIKDLRVAIPKAFEGEDYEHKKAAIMQELEQEIEKAINGIRREAADYGFLMKQGPQGFYFTPTRDGKKLSVDEYEALPREVQEEMEKAGRALQQKLEDVLSSTRQLEKDTRQKISDLDKQIVLVAAGPLVKKMKEKYEKFPKVLEYLQGILDDIAKNLEQIKPSAAAGMSCDGQNLFDRYRVNLFVNNGEIQGAPVVFENSPNYYNLFGKIEYNTQMGTLSTDHTMIKPGAIHRANGGFLVLQARDVLTDPGVWDTLKRALKNRLCFVENIGEQYRMVPTVSLRPEPIPLNIKVILVGSYQIYSLLYALDEDFQKFFKVKVDFDTEMPRTPENIAHYAAFVGAVCTRENLRHFDRTGLAELLEYGSRLAGNQNKLSTRFNEVIEVVYEAAAWAESENAPLVGSAHVMKAIEEKIYRSSRIEEKIREMMLKDVIMVDTDGEVVGQINGLSVIQLGDYAFGRPSRITASTFMGQEGVVNIERESHMSGSSHTKGVLTLVGYLGEKFAQDKPLRLSARITFEQLYDGVDGDSASSTELYCLLSSLSGLPIYQGLAVTGSVNQKGEIQPIGGVTEKVEGFFNLCRERGLNGRQGVIIPVQNIDNLMLRHEVTQAVAEGKFHIYAVSTVEEGIELLTGVPAGKRDENGRYPEGTVFGLVDARLAGYARGMKDFGPGGAGGGGGCGSGCCPGE